MPYRYHQISNNIFSYSLYAYDHSIETYILYNVHLMKLSLYLILRMRMRMSLRLRLSSGLGLLMWTRVMFFRGLAVAVGVGNSG